MSLMMAGAAAWRRSSAVPLTLAEVILARSPRAYWPLADASGTVMTDVSGNGRHGTYGAGVVLAQPSLVPSDSATSIRLPGTAVCTVPDAAWQDPAQLGLLCVVKPAAGGAFQHVLNKDTGGSNGWWIRCNSNNTFEISVHTTGGRITASTTEFTFTPGTEYLIEAGYDGSSIRIYVNGALRGSGSFPSTISANAIDIQFGRNGGALFPYNGHLQHVAMFAAAPTDAGALAAAQAAGMA